MNFKFLSPAVAAALLVTNIVAAHADTSFGATTTSEMRGSAARLELAIPMGGSGKESIPSLTFSAGPNWYQRSDSPYLPGRFDASSMLRFGYTLDGRGIALLGPLDLTQKNLFRLSADDSGDNARLEWIAIGVVAAAVLIYIGVCNAKIGNQDTKC